MQNTKFYATFLALVIFAGILSLSPVFSSLMNGVVVRSTGQISTGAYAYAKSGSARDIQAAVDWVAGHGGTGTVYIPEGTYNFVDVGQSWATVEVPAGISITGAPPQLDANGQVIAWRTVLNMPYAVPGTPTWFEVNVGGGVQNAPFRFSNISMIGWRYYNHVSTASSIGLYIETLLDFRVDHCSFQDLCWNAILIGWYEGTANNQYTTNTACGVVDHCRLVNSYGYPGFINYDDRTLDYGIGMRRWACRLWDPNVQNIWGQYTNYTIFIEDNYFSKWRHCVCSNDGFHYVFRNNIVDGDYGIGSIDGHGSYADSGHSQAVGTRCVEVYNNIFKNPDLTWGSEYSNRPWALNIRGGSWIVFNNTLIGYYGLLDFNNDWGNYAPYRPDCEVNQTYVWSNTLNGATIIHYNADSVQNVNYFLRAPNLAQDGFDYMPYPYPHPLTMEGL